MSRSGYTDDCEDQWALIRWRGAVNASIKGKRGQALLREIAAAMDSMPVKELVPNELQDDGGYCTLGVVGAARGMDMSKIDPEDRQAVAKAFGIAEALAAEVMYENDEHVDAWRWVDVEICGPMRPYYPDWNRHVRSVCVPNERAAEQRWSHMRAWVSAHLAKEQPHD